MSKRNEIAQKLLPHIFEVRKLQPYNTCVALDHLPFTDPIINVTNYVGQPELTLAFAKHL